MARSAPTKALPARDGETEDMLPSRGIQSPPTIHQVSRRPLGIGPVPWLGGVLIVAAVAGLVLLVLGSWLPGVVLLACSLAFLALLLVAVEREPDDPAARLAVTTADRARSQTRLLAAAARAWSRAGVALLRVSQRRYRLRWQLRRQLAPLGEAAYRGDEDRVERLKAEARELEQALREADREGSEAVGAARAEVESERAGSRAHPGDG